MLLPILFTLAFLSLSLPILMAPLRGRNATIVTTSERERADAGAAYNAALLALRDLEFDHDLGVVGDEDYARLRPQLVAQAASALETGQQERAERISAELEAAIRAQRQHSARDRSPVPRFCAQCGRPRDPGDRFCAACGVSFQ